MRQISNERDQLKTLLDEKEKEIYALQSLETESFFLLLLNKIKIAFVFLRVEQRESLEDENRQVHQTNSNTILRLQELESTGVQLQVTIENTR